MRYFEFLRKYIGKKCGLHIGPGITAMITIYPDNYEPPRAKNRLGDEYYYTIVEVGEDYVVLQAVLYKTGEPTRGMTWVYRLENTSLVLPQSWGDK